MYGAEVSMFPCVLCAPGVGPVYETEKPEEFMSYMENLMALGGGDEPEMCLSAIQVTQRLATADLTSNDYLLITA